MLALRILDFFYLDGYNSLINKFTDKDRNKFRQLRYYVNENYSAVYHKAWKEHDFKFCIALRKAKRADDYLGLYELIAEYTE